MTKEVPQEKAPFDDARAALSFALNADQVTTPTAYMNKAMAAVRVEMKRPKKARKMEGLEWLDPATMSAPELLEMERRRLKERRGGSLVRVEALKFRDGMDRHHLAGLILHHFARIETEYQVVLTGLCCNAYVPCSCRSLCCSGRRPTERWLNALSEECAIIQLRADVLKVPGKKGLSSQPILRRRIVEQYFTKSSETTLVGLAREAKVSATTAAEHREWITSYLAEAETQAWQEVMRVFDAAGITDHHL